ncbi:glycosyltransferase family 2 protein [Flavobacterium sp.]|uniref:glycosyltransferase family 2 protein n=1 Tax=Flavobacterium sp. TaxID=239 RepID=UPI0033415622
MRKAITVFTPTFNRAYCLGQLYESLLRQTASDFCWLIVDDGSSDTTKDLVAGWIAEQKIPITYLYQTNQGMHGAHNTAYAHIETPYNVCIDSDDYMPDDAIAQILAHLPQLEASDCAGMIGLDCDPQGKLIGTAIPEHWQRGTLNDLYRKGVTGDKKVVLKTQVVRQFPPYPIYPGEKLVPLGTLYLQIDQQYTWLYTNALLCVVEYLADGSSRNIFKQYERSPNGFFYSRLIELRFGHSFIYKFTRAMHLVSSAIFGRLSLFKNNPEKVITLLAIPFGILFHGYVLFKIANENPASN